VGRLVLAAFGAAGFADSRAQRAELLGEAAISLHQSGCESADIRAITIKPDAFGHHFHVGFTQASGGAVLAGRRAAVARFNTV